MRITFYGYNAFIVETKEKKIAIDPGALFFYWFRFTTLIPPSEWKEITHIFITHGDPDHYWHADRVADASDASVICNRSMLKNIDGKALLLGPRDKGLAFTTAFKNLHTLSVDETIEVDGISVTGIKTTHGELVLKIGPFSKTITPGADERIGWGAIGFDFTVDGKRIVNLGDTLLMEKEWEQIEAPDVLMLPIGGKTVHNTMDETEALEAVRIIKPKLVIPCHYNCPAFFTRKYNPADETSFARNVEALGIQCAVLHIGDTLELPDG